MEQQIENLASDLRALVQGLEDLTKLMAVDDPGAQYVSRLYLEAEKCWANALKIQNK